MPNTLSDAQKNKFSKRAEKLEKRIERFKNDAENATDLARMEKHLEICRIMISTANVSDYTPFDIELQLLAVELNVLREERRLNIATIAAEIGYKVRFILSTVRYRHELDKSLQKPR